MLVKKNDVTPERSVITVLYGTPGCGKTSLATTAKNPILIDTDRGYDRAVQRVDTLVATNWQDIASELETLRGYKTIIIDTAKAMLDDYLSAYAISKNYKLATNSLKRYGEMGEEFKLFVNTVRSYGADLIFICHDKETSEGDVIKHSPDCTGQSKDLLLRIADQVGYITKINGKRTISFEPMDNFIGKNVANLPTMEIPDSTDARFENAMAEIIDQVKKSIQSKSEEQRKAMEQLASVREMLSAAMTAEDANNLIKACAELPVVLRKPFFAEMKTKLEPRKIVYNKDSKTFVEKKDETND